SRKRKASVSQMMHSWSARPVPGFGGTGRHPDEVLFLTVWRKTTREQGQCPRTADLVEASHRLTSVVDLTFASASPRVVEANVKSKNHTRIQHLLVSPCF